MTIRVGVDLDGVLYNFGDSVKRYLDYIGQSDLWKSGPTPKPYWDFYKDWGWSGQEFVKLCNDGADAGFIFCGPARDGAVEAMERIARTGNEVIIVTDRQFGTTPQVSERNTVEWLTQHGIWYDELIFSTDKTVGKCDVFVEDKLENYDALTAAGTKAWLINRAWNFVDGGDARNRINSITDFATAVEALTVEQIADLTFS
jgi:FMN phosphatase YigB (HAD superfamily)